jgi:hypothetical protein
LERSNQLLVLPSVLAV